MRLKMWLSLVVLWILALSFYSYNSNKRYTIRYEQGAPNEIGIYCVDGSDPVVVGMEEKYFIVRCGAQQ